MRCYFLRAAITRRTASSICSRGIDVGSVGKRMGGAFRLRRGILILAGCVARTASLIRFPLLDFDIVRFPFRTKDNGTRLPNNSKSVFDLSKSCNACFQ
jgi:hypothetical protein